MRVHSYSFLYHIEKEYSIRLISILLNENLLFKIHYFNVLYTFIRRENS